ncbi:2-oxoglutarate translocator [Wukongibacter baidiensis]|uniref:hypothetical protein n=1 Tax=Wukongibacter baidiensis TaxID=1723361 RepID=UPI003D7FB3CD
MGCRKRIFKIRIKNDRILGILLVAVGTTIIFVILLPPSVWIVTLGIILIGIGYKLFLC